MNKTNRDTHAEMRFEGSMSPAMASAVNNRVIRPAPLVVEINLEYLDQDKQFYPPEEIYLAKRKLPLKRLMKMIGDEAFIFVWQSPFHSDDVPRFKVWQYSGRWVFNCDYVKSCGDQIDYLELRFQITTGQAIRLLCRLSGLK